MKKAYWAAAVVVLTIIFLANNVGCNSSSSNDEEISRLKKQVEDLQIENEKLRKNLRALTLLSGQKTTPGSKPEMKEPPSEWTPEQLLTAYFTVKWWQERIPMVLDPDKARPRMAEVYEGWTEEQLKNFYFRIHPITTSLTGLGEELRVLVDCGNEVNVPYLLVRTEKGLRIDWMKTQDEQKNKFLSDWGLTDAQVTVFVERKEQNSIATVLHVSIRNRSNADITYIKITCIARNSDGQYLGNEDAIEAITPQTEKIAEFSFMGINKTDLCKWEFTLDDATIQNSSGRKLQNAHRHIKLFEKTP